MTKPEPLKWCLITLFWAALVAWSTHPAVQAIGLFFLAVSGGVLAEENTAWREWKQ